MADAIPWVILGLSGAGGGALVELTELAAHLRRYGHFPWSPASAPRIVRVDGVLRRYESPKVYAVAVAIRLLVGGGVSAVIALGGPTSGFSAVVTGAGAYVIVDRWANAKDTRGGEQ